MFQDRWLLCSDRMALQGWWGRSESGPGTGMDIWGNQVSPLTDSERSNTNGPINR